jgi:hypothetical protein
MSGKTARHIRSFPPEAERAAARALLTALADRENSSTLARASRSATGRRSAQQRE